MVESQKQVGTPAGVYRTALPVAQYRLALTHWSVQVQMKCAEQDGVRQRQCLRVQLTDVKAHCVEISFLSCRSNYTLAESLDERGTAGRRVLP